MRFDECVEQAGSLREEAVANGFTEEAEKLDEICCACQRLCNEVGAYEIRFVLNDVEKHFILEAYDGITRNISRVREDINGMLRKRELYMVMEGDSP